MKKHFPFPGLLMLCVILSLSAVDGHAETRSPLVDGGAIYVESEPGGAEWFLDGLFCGTTPGRKFNLKPGMHQLIVRKQDFTLWASEETVRLGETTYVRARLGKKGPPPGEIWQEPITGIDFVWVPGGCFQMGSPSDEAGRDSDEGPQHKVCVDGFWMGRTEITNGQFRLFQQDHDSGAYNGLSLDGDDQPVVHVRRDRATVFAEWLGDKTGWAYMFRLPTEAEWEYACRAGTFEARFWGEDASRACQYANVHDKTSEKMNAFPWQHHGCDDGYPVTAPVGSFSPNPFGLYDMLGNVWEWCQDRYGKNAYAEHSDTNPRYRGPGPFIANRGGSWSDVPRSVRCTVRERLDPAFGNIYVGFRLVRVR